MRHLSTADKLLTAANNALNTLFNGDIKAARKNPADACATSQLDEQSKQHIAGLMRVNHCGEVCAQALYQGQALTAKLPEVRDKMEAAAAEENDHLAWCEQRLHQLDSRTSLLNPLFYAASFSVGALAGLAGDRWSLGFVAETERQVVRHLQSHLEQIPAQDQATRAILEQMKEDELHHATTAIEAGAAEFPYAVKKLMQAMAKVMTGSVYYL